MQRKLLLILLSSLSLIFIHQKVLPKLLLLTTPPSSQSAFTSQEDLNEVKTILKQPFTFLALGNQCFVFLSEDKSYVLKVCKAARYRSLLKPTSAKKKRHKASDFLSYDLAFKHLKEESQVTYLHLNTSKDLNTTLKLLDPLGLPYFLEADTLAFYIQKKATPLLKHLREASSEEASLTMKSLLGLFHSTCNKGLQIRDLGPKNIGIYENSPIWMDLGKIRKLSSSVDEEKELNRFSQQFSPLLESSSPHLFALFQEEMELSRKKSL